MKKFTMNIDDKNIAIKIHKLKKVYKNRKSDSFEALKGIKNPYTVYWDLMVLESLHL